MGYFKVKLVGCLLLQLKSQFTLSIRLRVCHNTILHFADGVSGATLERAPVIAFDRSDDLQHAFARRVSRRHLAPPATYLPSVPEFDAAVRAGMGWGLLIEAEAHDDIYAGRLVELVPGRRTEVPLYWQHWRLGSRMMTDLTDAVTYAARGAL